MGEAPGDWPQGELLPPRDLEFTAREPGENCVQWSQEMSHRTADLHRKMRPLLYHARHRESQVISAPTSPPSCPPVSSCCFPLAKPNRSLGGKGTVFRLVCLWNTEQRGKWIWGKWIERHRKYLYLNAWQNLLVKFPCKTVWACDFFFCEQIFI